MLLDSFRRASFVANFSQWGRREFFIDNPGGRERVLPGGRERVRERGCSSKEFFKSEREGLSRKWKGKFSLNLI